MTEEQLNRKLFSITNKVEKTLPPQKGNQGKVLSTDGTNPLWVAPSIAPGSVQYTQTEKDKLANIAPFANNYVHPSTHPASIISDLTEAVQDIVGALLSSNSGVTYDDASNTLTITSSGITNGSITNAKLANVPTATFKGRSTTGTGSPEDLTIAQAKTLLNLANSNSGDQDISGIATNTAAIGTLSSLTTSAKTNLVAAINEVKIVADTAAGGGTIVGDGTVTDAKLATDVKIGSLASLSTTAKSNVVSAINELNNSKAYASTVGTLSSLTTTDKSNLVAAVNEVKASSSVPADDSITNTKLATDVKVGSLASLTTTSKSNVVSALNELNINKANTSSLGTASSLNAPASGNAASTEVVKGSDTRLSDSRTPLTHTHTASAVTDFQSSVTANTTVAGHTTAIGTLSSLNTTAKTNLVSAINEVKATADAGSTPADGSVTNAKLATDVKVGSLATLTTTAKSTVVAAINEVKATADAAGGGSVPADGTITNTKLATDVKVGSLASLTTTAKGSVVAAVNEVKATIPTVYFDDTYIGGVGKDGLTVPTAYTVLKSDQDALQLYKASNLSDLASASTARTNLGLGTLATQSGTFSSKQDALTVTTTGSSGPATLSGGTLNIPQYTGGGGSSIGWVNVADYGAIGNGKVVGDGAITGSTNVLTSATANFTSGDVGKYVTVSRVGGAGIDITGTITGFTNSTTVTLSVTATNTSSSRLITYGTDNQAAITSALAAVPARGGRLVIPSGIYIIGSTVNITKAVIIQGEGGGVSTFNYSPVSTSGSATIIVTTKDIKAFNVNTPNVTFKELSLECYASDITAASIGIYFQSGVAFRLQNIGIRGFYNNVDMLTAYFWRVEGCWFGGAKNHNFVVRSTALPDAGDWCITDCWFYGEAPYDSVAGIYQESSGGGKIENTKFNTAGTYYTHNHILCNTGGTSDLNIVGCSFENYRDRAIKITTALAHVVISANQFAPIAQTNTIDIDAPICPDITVSGNNFAAANSTSAVTNVNELGLGYNRYYGYLEGKYPGSIGTNLLTTDPNAFNLWTPTNVTLTANATKDSDDTTLATKLVATTTNGKHNIGKSITKAASSLTYKLTTYLKNGGIPLTTVDAETSTGSGFFCVYNTSTATINTAITTMGSGFSIVSNYIQPAKNGFVKVEVVFTTNTQTDLSTYIIMFNGTTDIFAGNGVDGVYVYKTSLVLQ